MKYLPVVLHGQQPVSPPSRGAWIEIGNLAALTHIRKESPPSRGAWIEIKSTWICEKKIDVAPLAGGVD